MKVGFIGCVESSQLALQTLFDIEEVQVACVITKENSKNNADFCDLAPICKARSVPFHYERLAEREKSLEFLKSFDLDVIYCIGWSFLLSKDILNLTPKGVIGFHPAKLPKNRGRHPIIWALALGLEETASTFFVMDEGADSGDIVSQEMVMISPSDKAQDLYDKIMDVAVNQIRDFTKGLASNSIKPTKQDHNQATYWRKRSRKDGLIDFRMNSDSIHNLIRALSSPYPKAEFIYKDSYISVNDSMVAKESFPKNIEAGRVLKNDGQSILVKCAGENAIWLNEIDAHELPDVGEYL